MAEIRDHTQTTPAGTPDARCDGLCLHASDVGVPTVGDPVAYPHPECPQHGEAASAVRNSDG